MDAILDALQEGRLFELPENDKNHALQFLAHILEAFPQIPAGMDIVGLITAREMATNTALGHGWACPHARVSFEEDLMCVIGWSPGGIDYAARDGKRVKLIVMYVVPANQLNPYLREISIIAKALKAYPDTERLERAKDLNEVRNFLLDLIAETKTKVGPETRAKMIRLQAAPPVEAAAIADISSLILVPVTIITASGSKPVVLTQNGNLAESLDSAAGLAEKIEQEGFFQNSAWRILRRAATTYSGGRVVHDCLAISLARNVMTSEKPADKA